MEHDQPDGLVAFLELVARLPDDVRHRVVVDGNHRLVAMRAALAQAGLAEAHGTAYAPTVTVTPGDLTVTQGPPPVSPWVRWPPEVVGVVIFLWVLYCAYCVYKPDDQPIPPEVNVLIGAVLAALSHWLPRQQ